MAFGGNEMGSLPVTAASTTRSVGSPVCDSRVATKQGTGVASLCAEFLPGCEAIFALFFACIPCELDVQSTLSIQKNFPESSMTEAQADKILKELRTIKFCVTVLAVIIALASAEATFNL